MKKYVDYFERIQEVLEAFTNMLKNKHNTDLLRTYETCLNNAFYQSFNFSVQDLLLQPFQRMSRYHLLIKELGKKRKNNADGELKLVLQETLKCVEFTNRYLNEVKRDQEDISNIQTVFRKLNLPPELDSGRLRLSEIIGVAMFTNANESRRVLFRSVFLFETCLLILTNKYRQIFDKWDVVGKFSIYDIRCAKRCGENLKK